MFEQFKAFISPFTEKLENIFKIGSSTNIKGANKELQEIQLKTMRNIEDALKVGQFGFNSKQPLGSRNIVATIGKEKIVIANEHIASIIDVTTGNTVIYNEDGTYIKLEGSNINIKGTKIAIDGNLEVTGTIKGAGITDTITNVTLSTHTHPETGVTTLAPTPGS